MAAIQRHKVAGPAIILDEAEKVGSGRHNGHPHDALLPLMEVTSAKAYHDPCLQAPVDPSYVSLLLTANSIADLSGPPERPLPGYYLSGARHYGRHIGYFDQPQT